MGVNLNILIYDTEVYSNTGITYQYYMYNLLIINNFYFILFILTGG